MSFTVRFIVLALASFGLATLVVSALVGIAWCVRSWSERTLTRRPDSTAAMRADALFRLRLLPTAIAIAAASFTAVGLWRFESRDSAEVIGWTLRAGALLGALLLATFAVRLWQLHLETRRLLSLWLGDATPLALPAVSVPAFRIDTAFPVVAVVGIFRPTLVVDRTVLDACTNEELSAILAHEQGHLRRWDNMRRALFAATPDLLAWSWVGRVLRRDWRDATEEAADDVAAELGEETRVHLAHALLRVARLAPGLDSRTAALRTQLPASALYRGESVERRVRRLCQSQVEASAKSGHLTFACALGVMTMGVLLQDQLHHVMEAIVAALP